MLRLISVIGIAIAMLIGFIAISSKMKDDFTVRSQVVSVLKQMKNLATKELQCGIHKSTHRNNKTEKKKSEADPDVEMSAELDTTPLIENSVSGDTSSIDSSSSPEASEIETNTPDNLTDATEETENAGNSPREDNQPGKHSEIVRTMGYRVLDSGNVEVIAVFNNINGESGKTRVKSGSQVAIKCSCPSGKLTCDITESDINTNYLPKHLTRQ